MSLNLNQLRVFYAVSQAGSITRAADALRISQPAVSKQLAEFESASGVSLVDRLPRGIRLTPAGRSLAEYAERLFQVEGAAEAHLSTLRAGLSSRLRVGASTTIGSYLVPELFGALQREWPRVELSLEIANTNQVHELVRQDRVDLGLTEGLSGASDLVAAGFGEDEIIAISRPSAALDRSRIGVITLEEFLSSPWICREAGSGTREVLEEEFRSRGLAVKPAFELGSTEAVKKAVTMGLGVGFVSSLTVELELHAKRLVRVQLDNFSLKRVLHTVQLPERKLSPIATRFRELLIHPPQKSRATGYTI